MKDLLINFLISLVIIVVGGLLTIYLDVLIRKLYKKIKG